MTTIRTFLCTASAGLLFMIGAVEATSLNIQIGEAPATLDPQTTTGDRPDQIIGDLFEGLVAEDAQGRPVPGQAESWSVSSDGLSYTFHLRQGLRWSDGVALTADDFVYAFRRLISPATPSELAYLQFAIKNAEAIKTDKMEDITALGVVAPDPRTVIITLERPTPYLLNALQQPSAYPVPRHVVDKFGADWTRPENIVGNGAYKLAEVTPLLIRAVRNDAYHDAAAVETYSIAYHVLDDEAARMAFEAGRIDIATHYAMGGKKLPEIAHKTPALGLWYLVLNPAHASLARPEIRQALAMAIDRDALREAIGSGDLPAFAMVPPGVPGFETNSYRPAWVDTPIGERQAQARHILARAGFNTGNPLRLTLRTSKRDTQVKMGAAVGRMWREIGVVVDILSTDIPVHQAALFKGDFTAAGARWIMDYNDAGDVLNLLGSEHPNNYRAYSSPVMDALLKAAATQTDTARRMQMLHEAERLAMQDTAIIPLYWMTSNNLVAPDIGGFADNVRDVHRARWLRKRN